MSEPDGLELMERRREAEVTLREAGARFGCTYMPGWVNVDDALLMYWLVRRLRPRTIVQCGVCNGLSTAFMAIALARNGGPADIHAIDRPEVLAPENPAWRVPGQVYGVAIPEGRTSGWLVPDSCRSRVHIERGDAAARLPSLIDSLEGVDLFFHDSDHTYEHMVFEFRQIKPKLRPGGLVLAHDIAWNASLWDMADQWQVPAYNFRGSLGVAFC
jgi:predicted O-methyltransferase YrrM